MAIPVAAASIRERYSVISSDPFYAHASDTQIDSMVRLAVLLTGSRPVAMEVVVEVITRLESLKSPIGDAALRHATVRACRRQRRDTRRRRDVVATYAQTFVEGDYEGAEFLEVLGSLRHRERIAVVLRYYCGDSDDEIAALLSCSIPTARELVRRGMRNLQRMMPDD
jgi:DNA-directed RNA polymerase specialized sigma24 family protein